jgi:hypothetical protein
MAELAVARLMLQNGQITFIVGAPRSGTTWLAKIFDSHPDVLCRTEPDAVIADGRFPWLCRASDIDEYRPFAREYVDKLTKVRTVKSVGSLPVFPKRYQRPFAYQLRRAMIYGLHAVDAMSAPEALMEWLSVPDLIASEALAGVRIVIKSVNARGRIGLYANAMPASQVIFIVRHPCGQIASVMRGLKIGRFRAPDLDEILVTEQARSFGLSAERFGSLTLTEQLAWHWTILNQKVLDDLSATSGLMIVRYEDLVLDPIRRAQELFAFSGLYFGKETADFIEASTNTRITGGYYSVYQDPAVSLSRWESDLTETDQKSILDITLRAGAGRLYAAS